MPINSHVTSEEGKRKLQPKYSNPKKIRRKKKLKKKISKKNLSATFRNFKKISKSHQESEMCVMSKFGRFLCD